MSTGLTVRALTAAHPRGPDVVHSVSFAAPRGQVTALIGPNGAGKSTVLKAVLGLVPHRGQLAWDGVELGTLDRRARARAVAYVPQRSQLRARLSVRAVVELGRFAHRGALARASSADTVAVESALEATGALALAERPFPELSGGEQQRVLLARALATGSECLLLDEPTSALDVRQALRIHGVLRRLADAGCAVVVVLHDLSEVHRHADAAVMLHGGHVAVSGAVSEVLGPEPVRRVYGVELVPGGGFGVRLADSAGGP